MKLLESIAITFIWLLTLPIIFIIKLLKIKSIQISLLFLIVMSIGYLLLHLMAKSLGL